MEEEITENNECASLDVSEPEAEVAESPKPLAFTIDFGEGKTVDTQRYKNLVEKYQSRHKRGQSLSKFDESPSTAVKRYPLTGNLPRKSSYHSEGYFSSDEKVEKFKLQGARSAVLNAVISKGDLTLPLKTLPVMTQSFPNRNFDLPSINSPEIELKDVSSPELDFISPISPVVSQNKLKMSSSSLVKSVLTKQHSSPESFTPINDFPNDFNNDLNNLEVEKADSVSDAGTYTLDADNYTEEQKARMSIDNYYNIEQVSQIERTQEYVQSLANIAQTNESPTNQKVQNNSPRKLNKMLKTHSAEDPETNFDQGVFTSITASGVLSKRPEKIYHKRRSSLVQSEIFVEAYTSDSSAKQSCENIKVIQTVSTSRPKCETRNRFQDSLKRRSLNLDELTGLTANLPPTGFSSKYCPTKIPSPVHRPRSHDSQDLSDSSLETESYLKPTQNIISSLQARLSLDSDQESDYDRNYILNNDTKNLLKTKPMHVRHNSFDDRNIKISNKLEHFHNKNLQSIDQTLKSCNQYGQNKHRIQNSPNDSPIRRSSSFSLKNSLENSNQPKCLNKDANKNTLVTSVHRSSSTLVIKPNLKPQQYLDSESSTDEDFEKSTKAKKDLTNTRYNRAFSLRRARLEVDPPLPKCPNTPEMKRKFAPAEKSERTVSVDRKTSRAPDVQSRYMNITKNTKIPQKPSDVKLSAKPPPPKQSTSKPPVFSRTDSGRFSIRTSSKTNVPSKSVRREPSNKKQSGGRSNSTLSSREVEFQNWKRRKSYDPMKAAAEGKRKAELARKQSQNVMTQSYNENNQDCDSSPSHSSSVHRSQSFHGTAALEQLLSSEEEDLTLSGDEGFSPPTPSPSHLSPSKGNLRQIWIDRYSSNSKR